MVLTECGVCSSGYYKKFSKRNEKDTGKQEESGVLAKKRGKRGKRGRPYPGYSEDIVGQKTSDEVLIKLLKTYRKQLEFGNWGGCKVLSRYLLRDYGLRVNKKKVYRLCKQEFLLLPKPKKKLRKYGKICINRKINGPKQLWEFDIKQGFIHGENRAFYLLAFIDVFLRQIVGFHIGLSCKAIHLKMTLDEAFRKQKINRKDNRLVICSDNGSQMTSHQFRRHVEELGIQHEFTPFSCPEKNAYIESFFSIYEVEFLQTRYFRTFGQAYEQSLEFIDFYHKNRIHGSLDYLTPFEFKQRFNKQFIQAVPLSV